MVWLGWERELEGRSTSTTPRQGTAAGSVEPNNKLALGQETKASENRGCRWSEAVARQLQTSLQVEVLGYYVATTASPGVAYPERRCVRHGHVSGVRYRKFWSSVALSLSASRGGI